MHSAQLEHVGFVVTIRAHALDTVWSVQFRESWIPENASVRLE